MKNETEKLEQQLQGGLMYDVGSLNLGLCKRSLLSKQIHLNLIKEFLEFFLEFFSRAGECAPNGALCGASPESPHKGRVHCIRPVPGRWMARLRGYLKDS